MEEGCKGNCRRLNWRVRADAMLRPCTCAASTRCHLSPAPCLQPAHHGPTAPPLPAAPQAHDLARLPHYRRGKRAFVNTRKCIPLDNMQQVTFHIHSFSIIYIVNVVICLIKLNKRPIKPPISADENVYVNALLPHIMQLHCNIGCNLRILP